MKGCGIKIYWEDVIEDGIGYFRCGEIKERDKSSLCEKCLEKQNEN